MTTHQHTTTELDAARDAYLRATVFRGVTEAFRREPNIQSAALLVAQYWDDEAADAVHPCVVYSILDTPDLDAYFQSGQWDAETGEYVKDVVNGGDQLTIDDFELWRMTRWDANGDAIPLFAAFCCGGASQDMGYADAYRPYCVMRRNEDAELGFDLEIVATMLRPHLDGVTSMEEEI